MQNLDKLLEAITADYETANAKSIAQGNEYSVNRLAQMKSGEILSCKEGKKYIKVVFDNSVWGFIVNVHNDKDYPFGTLLKAASWATPARNGARGNVVEGDFSWCRWTGLEYKTPGRKGA